ncbi:uncharacterized protein LOC134828759 [Culicoides brevitarsis]|uniref:uncharacterized protein LOC134828759 n=1 Tax=Culicoides brevitarsis TaxID=469753 RepID=UPI00307BD123
MRPGPRLVVMALAFISGAQRGTTNTHNSANYKDNKLVGRNNLNIIYDIGQLDDDRGPLARVNPWLSACDLAPHRKSPDLQGQCTAGTLPVTRIEEGPGPPQPPPPECPLSCREQKQQKLNQQHNNSKSNKLKNMEITGIKKQECLSYLGEANEFSPEYLCKRKSSIETQLRNLRLRHCCERDALSALHYQAYLDVIKGNESMCVKRIKDLIETDQLASRITCELTEILTRFDCKKPYSLINHCDDCREAYRRWVCSTFIPYFASESDAKRMDASASNSNSSRSKSIQHRKTRDLSPPHVSTSTLLASFQSSSLIKNNDSSSNLHNSLTLPPVTIRRSRRKSHSEQKRIRIRPCLSVCQSVETKCPYLLPGDRAPALPTQYAGEPTFLCHDPNVHETVEQAEKSNNGPDDCCYWYCGGPLDGLCTNCPTKLFSNATNYDGLPRLANDTESSKTENLSAAAVHKQQQQIQLHKLMEQTNIYSESRCPIYNWTGPQTCVLQYPGPYFNISSALKKVKVNQHESEKQNHHFQKSSSFAVLSCSPTSIASLTLLSQFLINIQNNDNRIWTVFIYKIMLITTHITNILQNIIIKIAWTNITHINKFLLQLAEL